MFMQTNEGDWNIQATQLAFADFDFSISYHTLQPLKQQSSQSIEHLNQERKQGKNIMISTLKLWKNVYCW